MMSFAMLHRGDLTVLLHPLAHDSLEDHTRDAMWLGEMTRINVHHLTEVGGDEPEFPELGLGYSSSRD
jgi:aromatic ring-cleaving dioxygenase